MINTYDEGNELKITFHYSTDRIIKTKKLKGYRWDPDQKAWFILNNKNNLDHLEVLFGNEEIVNIIVKIVLPCMYIPK